LKWRLGRLLRVCHQKSYDFLAVHAAMIIEEKILQGFGLTPLRKKAKNTVYGILFHGMHLTPKYHNLGLWLQMVVRMRLQRCKYFKKIWNLMDFAGVIGSLLAIAFYAVRTIHMLIVTEKIEEDMYKGID